MAVVPRRDIVTAYATVSGSPPCIASPILMRPPPTMKGRFAERTRWLTASDVRELLKYAQNPRIISFGGGLPSPDSFPLEDLRVIFEELLREKDVGAFQYGPTQGDLRLREALATRMRARGIRAEAGRVLVTHGAQQALELLGRIFLEEGDIVVVSQPTYLGIFTALATYRPGYHGVPMDEEGILTDVLEEDLRALAMDELRPKFIYVVPTFHNPAGVTMSLRRRRALVDLAATYEVPVIEDDPYHELRFEGDPMPPVAGLDKEGWVIHLGSFSKILAPGFRIGWTFGPPEVVNKMSLAKQGADLFTNAFGQRVAERYVSLGMLERNLPRVRTMYREKRDVMLAAMEEHFPEDSRWTRPQGGMFLWVTTRPGLDTKGLLPTAAERGVVYVAGHGFFAGKPEVNHMRLNYSFPNIPDIRRGIATLGDVLAEKKRVKAPAEPART